MKGFARIAGLCALTLAVSGVVVAARPDPNKLPAIRVQDLHYGDVLFHYWADDDSGLQALTRLEAYSQWHLMPHHELDSQLLAAGLYLQLGMHNEAGTRFQSLLGNDVPVGVRNRAWFYLAKIWYERGYYDRSEQALSRITGTLSSELEAQRMNLLVNALMRQQRYDEAIQQARGWQGPADWMAFARFNLGVALVRAGRLSEADPILTGVGTLTTDSNELLELRDKANLALGFAYLQADNSAQARVSLERVRLDGPYSSRALLGAGWSRAASGDYKGALAPWMELRNRNLLDAAVQESYLAVPYAFAKLNAQAQAAQYYESALESFSKEAGQIDEAIDSIHGGHMLDDLLGSDKDTSRGWAWQLKTLPDSAQSRYLYTLLADNDFQEGLKNYRDLGFLQRSLTGWDDTLDAFDAMIDTRGRAYAERLPRTDALLASDAPQQLRTARAALESQLETIENGADVAALGTNEERDQWARVNRLEEQAATLPSSLEATEMRDKIHLMKGALYWQLHAEFKARAYAEHKQLRELDAALQELQNRWVRVQRARETVPTNTGEFATRIAALTERIKTLRSALATAQTAQSQYLATLAETELRSQQERLTAYSEQARYALADIYDRSTSQGGASNQAAPSKDGASDSGAAPGTPQQTPVPPDSSTPAAPLESK